MTDESKPGKVVSFPKKGAAVPKIGASPEEFPDDGFVESLGVEYLVDEDPEAKLAPPKKRWISVPDMLADRIKRVSDGQLTPVGCIVIMLGDDEKDDSEQIAFFTMGLTRMEILGLLAEMGREIP